MSFKRDGDDSNLLSKLRKRRIGELLSESIPKDEAKLLSNGRFTCTVCNSIPIFDTVNMLMVHRQGKKHLANQRIHESKQRELKELIAVRKHEQFLKDGTTSIPMSASSSGGILTSAPYNPCVKKARLRPTERKPRVDFQASSSTSQDNQNLNCTSILTHGATLTSDLPGYPKAPVMSREDIASQQLSGPVIHDHQLKRLFEVKQDPEELTITPYQSRRKTETAKPKFLNLVAHCQNGMSWGQPISSSHRPAQFNPPPPVSTSSVNGLVEKTKFDVSREVVVSKNLTCTSHSPSPQPQTSANSPEPNVPKKKATDSVRIQTLRQLQGSGWKRDWDGKWIKDEDAEFDSDEEPPNI